MESLSIEELFHLYANDVNHFLSYYMGQHDVEDLVQETFLKALKGLNSYKGRASYKTWLISIARNVAIDSVRKQKYKSSAADDFYFNVPSPDRQPDELVELYDTYQFLLLTLEEIKPKYREIILMRTVMDLSLPEISEVYGWTTNRVRVMLHRAIKEARKNIQLKGGVMDDMAR